MTVTLSGFSELSAVFDAAPVKLRAEAERVVSKTAFEIKRDAQSRVRGGIRGKYLPHYARSIDYDIEDGGLAAEVGPNSGSTQGRFGRGVEFGSSNHGPIPHLLPAADDQELKFFKAMGDATKEAL